MLTDLWHAGAGNAMGHIDVSRGVDAIVVAPAGADFLAKLAHGRADGLPSILCLPRECSLLVAPAMNRQTWAHAATQRNVAQLQGERCRHPRPRPEASVAVLVAGGTPLPTRWGVARLPKIRKLAVGRAIVSEIARKVR